METGLSEKISQAVLSALLMIGAVLLHYRHHRPEAVVTVEHDRIKQEISLEQAVAIMKERARININKADIARLTAIPGIGKGLAAEISAFRKKGGVFTAEEDLLKIHGIGPGKLKKMREYIKFSD